MILLNLYSLLCLFFTFVLSNDIACYCDSFNAGFDSNLNDCGSARLWPSPWELLVSSNDDSELSIQDVTAEPPFNFKAPAQHWVKLLPGERNELTPFLQRSLILQGNAVEVTFELSGPRSLEGNGVGRIGDYVQVDYRHSSENWKRAVRARHGGGDDPEVFSFVLSLGSVPVETYLRISAQVTNVRDEFFAISNLRISSESGCPGEVKERVCSEETDFTDGLREKWEATDDVRAQVSYVSADSANDDESFGLDSDFIRCSVTRSHELIPLLIRRDVPLGGGVVSLKLRVSGHPSLESEGSAIDIFVVQFRRPLLNDEWISGGSVSIGGGAPKTVLFKLGDFSNVTVDEMTDIRFLMEVTDHQSEFYLIDTVQILIQSSQCPLDLGFAAEEPNPPLSSAYVVCGSEDFVDAQGRPSLAGWDTQLDGQASAFSADSPGQSSHGLRGNFAKLSVSTANSMLPVMSRDDLSVAGGPTVLYARISGPEGLESEEGSSQDSFQVQWRRPASVGAWVGAGTVHPAGGEVQEFYFDLGDTSFVNERTELRILISISDVNGEYFVVNDLKALVDTGGDACPNFPSVTSPPSPPISPPPSLPPSTSTCIAAELFDFDELDAYVPSERNFITSIPFAPDPSLTVEIEADGCSNQAVLYDTSCESVGSLSNAECASPCTPGEEPCFDGFKYCGCDPDLGAPNRLCVTEKFTQAGGPGEGADGEPGAAFPNCQPLGKVLIIQENVNRPADDCAAGGALRLKFPRPVHVLQLQMLDFEEFKLTCLSGAGEPIGESFENVASGDNARGIFDLEFVDRCSTVELSSGSSFGLTGIVFEDGVGLCPPTPSPPLPPSKECVAFTATDTFDDPPSYSVASSSGGWATDWGDSDDNDPALGDVLIESGHLRLLGDSSFAYRGLEAFFHLSLSMSFTINDQDAILYIDVLPPGERRWVNGIAEYFFTGEALSTVENLSLDGYISRSPLSATTFIRLRSTNAPKIGTFIKEISVKHSCSPTVPPAKPSPAPTAPNVFFSPTAVDEGTPLVTSTPLSSTAPVLPQLAASLWRPSLSDLSGPMVDCGCATVGVATLLEIIIRHPLTGDLVQLTGSLPTLLLTAKRAESSPLLKRQSEDALIQLGDLKVVPGILQQELTLLVNDQLFLEVAVAGEPLGTVSVFVQPASSSFVSSSAPAIVGTSPSYRDNGGSLMGLFVALGIFAVFEVICILVSLLIQRRSRLKSEESESFHRLRWASGTACVCVAISIIMELLCLCIAAERAVYAAVFAALRFLLSVGLVIIVLRRVGQPPVNGVSGKRRILYPTALYGCACAVTLILCSALAIIDDESGSATRQWLVAAAILAGCGLLGTVLFIASGAVAMDQSEKHANGVNRLRRAAERTNRAGGVAADHRHLHHRHQHHLHHLHENDMDLNDVSDAEFGGTVDLSILSSPSSTAASSTQSSRQPSPRRSKIRRSRQISPPEPGSGAKKSSSGKKKFVDSDEDSPYAKTSEVLEDNQYASVEIISKE